ncbi:MAG TPA: 1,4-dihydroxy-6-naphthoate synthase [Flavipsychrobacter sp.]|nr:1,4-dihydroxy-6-naphthoate synthase [Flavipsychrobacter sp.]
MKLTLGFSPCPNDTFIFDALVNNKIDTQDLTFDYVMEDVETLNKWAEAGKLDITKLSYNTFLRVVKDYALLQSGSALGKGVGPLLISNREVDKAELSDWLIDKKICIPGFHTTANLLLSLAFPKATHKTALVFHEIEDAVINGTYDAGLIIHENRFTYQEKGLKKLIDLGDWWEQNMNVPIPLGGIVMKRSFPKDLIRKVDDLIRESVLFSWKSYPHLSPFITENAQEMEESVMRKHIELYVNDYTTELGTEGTQAVTRMFEKAAANGLIDSHVPSMFA